MLARRVSSQAMKLLRCWTQPGRSRSRREKSGSPFRFRSGSSAASSDTARHQAHTAPTVLHLRAVEGVNGWRR